MRFVLFFTSICVGFIVLLGCLFAFNTDIPLLKPVRTHVEQALEATTNWVHGIRYSKDLQYYGIETLEPTSLEYLVPLEKSVSWWNFNTSIVRARLLRHPLVREASVERCGMFSWKCFKLQIEERRPAFLAGLNEQLWILGDDGSFVTQYRKSLIQKARLHIDPDTLPTVDGLGAKEDSPQLIQGRARYVARVISTVEENTPYKVKGIRLRNNGECVMRFARVPFPVVFGASHDKEGRLALELKRLESLLRFLKQHLTEIVSVDLAFNKLAVVRFKDEENVPNLTVEPPAVDS